MFEIRKYVDIVMPGKADRTIAEEAKISDYNRDLFNVYIAAFLTLLTAFVSRGWVEGVLGTATDGAATASTTLNPVGNPISAIVTFVLSAVVVLITIKLLHWLVSGLGGKGEYQNLFHVLSILIVSEHAYSLVKNGAITALAIPFGTMSIVIVGFIAGFISLYFIYLKYLIIKNVYGEITGSKIALAMIGWYIILMAIGFAIGDIRTAVGI